MSRRLWSGICLTPWLLASSGCTTMPFVNSATRNSLPTERKLAIAQTFERQGHDARAQQIYSQILAMDPNSAIAAERLESLIARSNDSANQPVAQLKKVPAIKSAKTHAPAAIPTLRDTIADASKPQNSNEQGASHKPPLPAPVDSRGADSRLEAHLVVDRTSEAPEPAPQALDELTEVPPSPAQALAKTTPTSTTPLGEEEIFWELPERRSAPAENMTPIVSGTGQTDPPVPLEIDHEIPESLTAEIELSPPPVRHGDALVEEHQNLFGDIAPSTLGEIREQSGDLQDVLLSIAVDPNVQPARRARAIFLLGQMGPGAIQVVASLKELMSTTLDSTLRMETAEAILLIHPDNDDAVHSLLESLKSEDPKVKWYAAFALRLAGSARPASSKLAVERLVFATAEGDLRLRRMAMLSLGAFGPSAINAVPTLTSALNDSDPMTRVIAATSLNLITKSPAPAPQYVSRASGSSDQ